MFFNLVALGVSFFIIDVNFDMEYCEYIDTENLKHLAPFREIR